MEGLNISEFLNWIIFGGGAVFASSWVLERISWFQEKTAEEKQLITYGTSSAFGIIAYVLVTYAPGFVTAAQPYFFILSGTFIMIFLNNAFHHFDKGQPKG